MKECFPNSLDGVWLVKTWLAGFFFCTMLTPTADLTCPLSLQSPDWELFSLDTQLENGADSCADCPKAGFEKKGSRRGTLQRKGSLGWSVVHVTPLRDSLSVRRDAVPCWTVTFVTAQSPPRLVAPVRPDRKRRRL